MPDIENLEYLYRLITKLVAENSDLRKQLESERQITAMYVNLWNDNRKVSSGKPKEEF